MLAIPVYIPGLAFILLYKNEVEPAILVLLASSFSFYDFYKNYNLIISIKGYLKRIIISAIIITACFYLVEVSPEKDNAKAGALIFLLIPCVFITMHMVLSSKPAKAFKGLYEANNK